MLSEFSPWLQEVKGDYKQACLRTFSIHHEEKTALKKHMNSDMHKACMKSIETNTLLAYTSSSLGETQKVSARESTSVYHGVKHGHCYISQQCTINLIKEFFSSSTTVAKHLLCARTKSRAVVCNVLAPYFTCKIIDEISESRFYSISFDASNKENIKTYPFAVQYFSDVGIKRSKEIFHDSKLIFLFYIEVLFNLLMMHVNQQWTCLIMR